MNSISNTISSTMDTSRISGMISGMDTEEIVKGLVKAHQDKVDSLNGDKQLLLWKQEAYTKTLEDINEFKDKYFDLLEPKSNILSNSNLKGVSTFSNLEDTDRFAEIIVNSDAVVGNHTINRINQVATTTSTSSTSRVKGTIAGTVNLAEGSKTYNEETFSINLDGVIKTIVIDGEFTGEELKNYLNSKLDGEFGMDRINADINLEGNLSLQAENSIIQVSKGEDGKDFLSTVGMKEGDKNIINIYNSLNSELNAVEDISFKINGVDFNFKNTTSIYDMMREINNSQGGVNISYSSIKDEFTLETKDTGQGSKIEIENVQGNIFGPNSKIKIQDTIINNGQDAEFYLDDEEQNNPIKRSNNVFNIDGTTFSLKEATTEEINYSITKNTEEVFEKIRNFVDDFNKIYSNIKDKTSEKIERDYPPLTDEQKEEMTESEIEKWEEKSKKGLLRNDSILSSILNNMRNSFYDKIQGVQINFKDIGIENSKNYNKFELVIDETKLKESLEKYPEEVLGLFNKEENIKYSPILSSLERTERYDEVGFGQRISDILMEATRTRRNINGYKGTLIEKVGIDGDISENNNFMTEALKRIEDKIKKAVDKMKEKEDFHWKKFTRMETVINQLNAQSESLYGMMMS